MQLNSFIDHTLLKPTATEADIEQLCREAIDYNFFSVCVNSSYICLANRFLKESDVQICSVVGFPLGAMSSRAKIYETERAMTDGANEIDMVLNLGFLKSGRHNDVLQEIAFIKNTIGNNVLKVILETCYLTDSEKELACKLAVEAGADFVKTSTGFGTGGATEADILLMQHAVKGEAKLKASGGIRDAETAMKFIDLGVHRLGTSRGIAIVNVMQRNAEY